MNRVAFLALSITLAGCHGTTPDADEQVRILQSQLAEANARIADLGHQLQQERDLADAKIGPCCVNGSVEGNAANVSNEDDAD